MTKKVVEATPQGNGTLLTYEDGKTEFLEGVTVTLNKNKQVDPVDDSSDDEEAMLNQMRK